MGMWEPVDFRQRQRVVSWPSGFDPTALPAPEYSDGDRVQFVRDELCARGNCTAGTPIVRSLY